MHAWVGFALTMWIAALAAMQPAPGPAAPSPVSTLAPISGDQTPNPAPTSSAAPKLLGHVVVSAFCASFIDRFNVAARTMVADDARLDDAVAAVRGYENDFSRFDGLFSSWDHRLHLMAALKDLLATIPKTQAAVDELRGQAKSADDPQRRDALEQSAEKLQESVDHQRIVAWEMQDLVGLMIDTHTSEDTIAHAQSGILDPKQSFTVDALDAPVPHPGEELATGTATESAQPSATEQVLHVPRDRQTIGEAEAGAAAAAARVVRSCVQDAKGVDTPLPSP